MSLEAPSEAIPAGKRRRPATFVYFVSAWPSRLIKIGVASNMSQRLAALKTGNPEKLSVLGLIRGSHPEKLESILHREFRADRQQGEWFKPSPRLEAFISKHARTLEQDEADQRAAMMADWIARGVVRPATKTETRRMNRKDKLARYKLARGIA